MTDHEEAALAEVIRAARKVQDYLWRGDGNVRFGGSVDVWCRLLQKRVDKLRAVDVARPGAAVEVRKRLLQTGALAVALIGRLDADGLPAPIAPSVDTHCHCGDPLVDGDCPRCALDELGDAFR